jgi:hypothetical protein
MNVVRFNLNHGIVLCLILPRTIPLSDPYQIQYPTKRETPSNAAKSKITAGTTVAQTNCTGKVAHCVQDAVYAMPKSHKKTLPQCSISYNHPASVHQKGKL